MIMSTVIIIKYTSLYFLGHLEALFDYDFFITHSSGRAIHLSEVSSQKKKLSFLPWIFELGADQEKMGPSNCLIFTQEMSMLFMNAIGLVTPKENTASSQNVRHTIYSLAPLHIDSAWTSTVI